MQKNLVKIWRARQQSECDGDVGLRFSLECPQLRPHPESDGKAPPIYKLFS